MQARTFFYYHELAREVRNEEMNEWADLAIASSQSIEWYEHLKRRYRSEAERSPEPEEIQNKTLSGNHAHAALIDLFGRHRR